MKRLVLAVLALLVPAMSASGATLRVGEPAPPFTLADLYGRTISLDYFDGHPGVILFWSTAVPRSVELLRDLGAYQQRWGRDDLAIVAVNTDGGTADAGGRAPVRGVAERLGIVFPVLADGGVVALAYGVDELPTAVVVDAGGRVSRVFEGYLAGSSRDELKTSLLLAMGRGPEEVVAAAGSCSIPRSRTCARINDRDPSAANPAVMAVRYCNCHGDAEAAQIMLSAVSGKGRQGPDLRFALAHTLLLEGRAAQARRAFEALRDQYPRESWGEWGLGLVALAEGNADAAIAHLEAARAGGWSIPEAETAVLKYLEGYWRANRVAPREEQFLALFQELDSVRVCYRRLNGKG
jgi:peroxiredoxin